jgi:hypothetical protein
MSEASKTDEMITEGKIAHIRHILDAPLETDDDYAELTKLVEDESQEPHNSD